MRALHGAIPMAAETFTWDRWGNEITAVASIVLAFVLAGLIDRAITKRLRKLSSAVEHGELSPETATRLRFLRRIVYSAIVLIGILIAFSQFAGLKNVAASLLASGAIAAAVIGFAARQVLANVIAGIMLAVTQPIRVGDWIALGDDYGLVEDVRLNYTTLRTAADQRIIVPNEKLVTGVLRNDTLGGITVGLDVSVWVAPDVSPEVAIGVLEQETGKDAFLVEAVPWGMRIAVGADPVAPAEKFKAEAELRRRCLNVLHAADLLPRQEHRSPGRTPDDAPDP